MQDALWMTIGSGAHFSHSEPMIVRIFVFSFESFSAIVCRQKSRLHAPNINRMGNGNLSREVMPLNDVHLRPFLPSQADVSDTFRQSREAPGREPLLDVFHLPSQLSLIF